jgi:hypothetical protein
MAIISFDIGNPIFDIDTRLLGSDMQLFLKSLWFQRAIV